MMIFYFFIGFIIGASITSWIELRWEERKKEREAKEHDNNREE